MSLRQLVNKRYWFKKCLYKVLATQNINNVSDGFIFILQKHKFVVQFQKYTCYGTLAEQMNLQDIFITHLVRTGSQFILLVLVLVFYI